MKVVRLFEDNMLEHEKAIIDKLNLDIDFEVKVSNTKQEIIANAKDADAIITVYEQLDKDVLKNLKNLKLVRFIRIIN